MRNASRVMYKIGRIFSFVLLALFAVLFVVYSILLVVHIIQGVDAAVIGADIGTMIWALIWTGLVIVLIILATRAIKNMEEDAKANGPHIVMIVFGAITGDIFYLLGGIFGLIAIGQENGSQE